MSEVADKILDVVVRIVDDVSSVALVCEIMPVALVVMRSAGRGAGVRLVVG